jgi:hypothetical protein
VALTGTNPVRPCVSIVSSSQANHGAMVTSFTDNDNIQLRYFSTDSLGLRIDYSPDFDLLVRTTGKIGSVGLLANRDGGIERWGKG